MTIREFESGMDQQCAGYDSLSGLVRGDCVIRTEPELPIGGEAQDLIFRHQQVTTTLELAQYLNVSGSGVINAQWFTQNVKKFLWQGKVDDAIACNASCTFKQAENFCAYFEKHRQRIINYQYYQAKQICSIGKACSSKLNILLNRLTVELKFLMHNGKLRMFLKSLLTVVPILMD